MSPSRSAGPAEAAPEILLTSPERGPAARALKRVLLALFSLWVLPRLGLYRLCSRLWGRERAFAWGAESVGRVPGLRGVFLRQAYYRGVLDACGRDVTIGWNSTISKSHARLGQRVYIGRGCSLGYVDVGDGALIADGVQVPSGAHQHPTDCDANARAETQRFVRVSIGAGAWLGAGAIVMADVGEYAVVGAGAVVTHSVAARTTVAGVPARPLAQG